MTKNIKSIKEDIDYYNKELIQTIKNYKKYEIWYKSNDKNIDKNYLEFVMGANKSTRNDFNLKLIKLNKILDLHTQNKN